MAALFVHEAGNLAGLPIVLLHGGGQRELCMLQRPAAVSLLTLH